jgi:outer membrane protein OmpA-like peptidoglycan-associated protein
MMRMVWLSVGIAVALLLSSAAALAQSAEVDVKGGKDHPLLTRYQGSWLVAAETRDFEASQVPSAYERANNAWVKAQTVEGERARRVYVAPRGRGPLEVQRNYEQALTQAGASRLLACAPTEPCASALSDLHQGYVTWVMGLAAGLQVGDAFGAINNSRQGRRHALFRLQQGGADAYVSILTTEADGTAAAPLPGRAVTVVEIVRPRAMDTGKVAVTNADALGKGLAAEGKVALYGIYFDTAKADIKPESKAQLDEMGKLLDANKNLRVFVVGHTDNQGALDANLALSQKRAEAIQAALVKDYKIDARRLAARGVANFAPVASNAQEAGRARNRRVELVEQ